MSEQVDPTSGLTSDEMKVMNSLCETYKLFLDLERQHPDELHDFVDAVH